MKSLHFLGLRVKPEDDNIKQMLADDKEGETPTGSADDKWVFWGTPNGKNIVWMLGSTPPIVFFVFFLLPLFKST